MEPEELMLLCSEACDQAYDYVGMMQLTGTEGTAKVVSNVTRYEIHGDYATLHVSSRIADTMTLGLNVDGVAYNGDDVIFEMFDDVSMTVTLFPSEKLRSILLSEEKHKIDVIVDHRWLMKRTKEHYMAFGDRIGVPKKDPHLESMFPKCMNPTDEQRSAVATILGNKMSYIWGAPGTGKTQFVMTPAIMAYMRTGGRVAVVAPNDNSLERVLRSFLEMIKKVDPKGEILDMDRDIVRLGTATSSFARDYPNVCEKRGVAAQIARREETIWALKKVQFEKDCDSVRPLLDRIFSLYDEYDASGRDRKKQIVRHVRVLFSAVRIGMSSSEWFQSVAETVDDRNMREMTRRIYGMMFDTTRPARDITEYAEVGREAVIKKISILEAEVAELKKQDPAAKVETAKIVAMTPQMFIGRYGPVAENGYARLNVDHVFIDEAGYCNLIQTLPLFTLGVPVTMLGDHMQLPPVCEINVDAIRGGISDTNVLRFAFVWEMSALFAEDAITRNIDQLQSLYLEGRLPIFRLTKRANLTQTHRFRDDLASALDECVYHNGMSGMSGNPFEIVCIDAPCGERDGRENTAEALAVGRYIKESGVDASRFAVLTPYRKQLSLLQSMYPGMKDNIHTVHGSQGREWDTVVLSVTDGQFTEMDAPMRFTSTEDPNSDGIRIMNTAVSRARNRLVLICDRRFWINKENELVGRLVRVATTTYTSTLPMPDIQTSETSSLE